MKARGFTLVELIVVVAIGVTLLAVLFSVAKSRGEKQEAERQHLPKEAIQHR